MDHLGLHFGWFRNLFRSIFKSKSKSKKQLFCMLFFCSVWSNLGSKLVPCLGGIAGKSALWVVQGRLEDVALISCPSWLPFGTLLGRFFHLFVAFWHPFQRILGSSSFLFLRLLDFFEICFRSVFTPCLERRTQNRIHPGLADCAKRLTNIICSCLV